MKQKGRRSSPPPSVWSRFVLSVLLERHAALLLVPLVYFSGMLLFMGNGGVEVSHAVSLPPPLPASLHESAGFGSSLLNSSPSQPPPPPPQDYCGISAQAWGQLDLLALRDTSNGTTVIVVRVRQEND